MKDYIREKLKFTNDKYDDYLGQNPSLIWKR